MLAKIRLSSFIFDATVWVFLECLYRRFMQIKFPEEPIFHLNGLSTSMGDSSIFTDKRFENVNLKLKHWIWHFWQINPNHTAPDGIEWSETLYSEKYFALTFQFYILCLTPRRTCVIGLKSHFPCLWETKNMAQTASVVFGSNPKI